MTAQHWLRENGYEDVGRLIDEVMAEFKAHGSKQRRNWWDVLAGDVNGKPLVVSGRAFPVLQVAQRRQGKPLIPNAISRNPNVVRSHGIESFEIGEVVEDPERRVYLEDFGLVGCGDRFVSDQEGRRP